MLLKRLWIAIVTLLAVGPPRQSPVAVDAELFPAALVGGPVVVTLSIRNDSPGDLSLDLGQDRVGAFTFTITDPVGRTRTITPGLREGAVDDRVVRLTRAGAIRHRLLLNEWYEFQPGSHQVRVDLKASVALSRLTPVELRKTWSFRLSVSPSDPSALTTICAALVAEYTRNDPPRVLQPDERVRLAEYKALMEERDFAARQLAHIQDPVAIPFLERLLANRIDSRHSFFEALVRIGGPEAKAALERLSRHSTDWVAQNAKQALARIR